MSYQLPVPWYVGRKVGIRFPDQPSELLSELFSRTIYARAGEGQETLIGVMVASDLAAHVVEVHNNSIGEPEGGPAHGLVDGKGNPVP